MNITRLNLLSDDLKISKGNKQIKNYIKELEENIKSSKKLLIELESKLEIPDALLKTIYEDLRYFTQTIKGAIPEQQSILVSKYVDRIEWNLTTSVLSIYTRIQQPGVDPGPSQPILEKTLSVTIMKFRLKQTNLPY